jgi:hypothetical protein
MKSGCWLHAALTAGLLGGADASAAASDGGDGGAGVAACRGEVCLPPPALRVVAHWRLRASLCEN